MEIIIHRINKIKELKKISNKYGVEIDIRTDGSKLILNHDAFTKGDRLIDYIENYKHKTLVLNIKEAGIENEVLPPVGSDRFLFSRLAELRRCDVFRLCGSFGFRGRNNRD